MTDDVPDDADTAAGVEDEPGTTADRSVDRADAASPDAVREAAREFERRGRPYARATVVRREPPVSANVGDSAVITPDGDLVGWVGGAECARSVVVNVATEALDREEPVLIGLAPDPSDVDRPGLESYPMTCHSGGTLEVFVEPVTPAPELVVVGESPVARSLARFAGDLAFDVTVVADPETPVDELPDADETVPATDPGAVAHAIPDARFVVVASMGEYDELGLEAGVRAGPEYIGLVASDERRDELARTVADCLDAGGDAVGGAVTTPTGLDVGAKTPEEIAVSILAELVALRRDAEGPIPLDVADASAPEFAPESADGDANEQAAGREPATGSDGQQATDAETAVDPVCGMEVSLDEAETTVEHAGETYYFCGQGCADAFADDPGDYLEVTTGG